MTEFGKEVKMSDVTTEENTTSFTEIEFDQYVSDKLRLMWTKIEGTKNLLRNGQQIVAYEQIQGISDGLRHLVGGFDKRVTELSGESNESNPD